MIFLQFDDSDFTLKDLKGCSTGFKKLFICLFTVHEPLRVFEGTNFVCFFLFLKSLVSGYTNCSRDPF